MNQYNTIYIKLSDSQLNKLKSGIKNGTEVTSNLSSNVISNSYDEINFPHKLSLTNTKVSRLRKPFANNSSANTKLSKTQLPKIVQLGGFLGRLLGLLIKTSLPLIKNVLKPSAKSVLIPIRINSITISNRCSYSKENFWLKYNNINNFKRRNQ